MRRCLLLFVIALSFGVVRAQACSPAHVDTLQESADKSGLIMIVQVMEVAFHPDRDRDDLVLPRYAAKFRVVETLKGDVRGVKLLSGGDGGDCGLTLMAGRYVLVLADSASRVVPVSEHRSSNLGPVWPDSDWKNENARIQALRNYLHDGEPIDRCLNWTQFEFPLSEPDEREVDRCKAVISSVLKQPD